MAKGVAPPSLIWFFAFLALAKLMFRAPALQELAIRQGLGWPTNWGGVEIATSILGVCEDMLRRVGRDLNWECNVIEPVAQTEVSRIIFKESEHRARRATMEARRDAAATAAGSSRSPRGTRSLGAARPSGAARPRGGATPRGSRPGTPRESRPGTPRGSVGSAAAADEDPSRSSRSQQVTVVSSRRVAAGESSK